MLSLGEAAKLAGVGKTTLARSIAKGVMSATRLPDGRYQVDVAELERCYPLRAVTPVTPDPVHHATPARDPETEVRLAALEVEIKGLRALLDEVRSSRDDWKGQATRLVTALPASTSSTSTTTSSTSTPQAEPPRRRWRFW